MLFMAALRLEPARQLACTACADKGSSSKAGSETQSGRRQAEERPGACNKLRGRLRQREEY